MATFRKWKSINKFSDAFIKAQKFQISKFAYRGKIKLHGTNAGILFENGEVYPQKRSDFITVWDDNCGFAKFVSELDINVPDTNMIFYGEWAGPGVQKSDAVAMIDQKSFFVFSVYDLQNEVMIIEPSEIKEIVDDAFGDHKQIFVIPWYSDEVEIDFSLQGSCQRFIDGVMNEVDNVIAKKDPYIESVFGVDGPGEGLVYYGIHAQRIDGTTVDQDLLLGYIFKAKTEVHSVQKSKKRNHVAPEKPDGIDDFIDMFFTEQRFEQMLRQIGGKATKEKTGQFMKAVMSDVYKESQQEVLLADFEWKDVPKYAAPKAKTWWFAECDRL